MAEHQPRSPDEHRKLFQLYSNYVYAIVWRILGQAGSSEDVEECVSDIFAEVFSKLDSVYENSMKAYIGTVSRRMALNRFQKLTSGKMKTISLEDISVSDMASDVNITEDYEKAEQAGTLLNLILSLGEPDSSIIIQKYYYDRNSVEIAKIVNLNPVTVRMRLSRALKRLKKLLEENHITYEEGYL